MKKIFSLLIVTAVLLLTVGCFDSREIDETAYIIALGIDKGNEGEYRYTFQFAAPLAFGGEGGAESDPEKNPAVRNTVIEAADFYTARNMLNNFLVKNIDMSHLKLIVFDSDLENEGFLRHSQLLSRERQVRPHTTLAVAEKSAEEFLQNVNPELEANTAKYYELMGLRSNNVYAPSIRLREFVDRMGSGGGTVLPLARVCDLEKSEDFTKAAQKGNEDWVSPGSDRISTSKSELQGMVIFSGGKPSGTMDGDSALIYNILSGGIEKFTVTLKNNRAENEKMSFVVRICAPAQYTVTESDGKYRIDVGLRLDARYLGEGLPEGYKSQEELMADFEKLTSERILDFLYATSRNFESDILQIGNSLKMKCLTYEDWENLNWNGKYKTAEFDVKIRGM